MTTQTDNPNRQQDLEAENVELRRRLAEHDLRDQQRAADEEIISDKMSRGLSRAQALQVIQRQRDFDVAKANEKAARQEKLAGILTGRETMAEAIARARTVFPEHLSLSIIRAEVIEFMRAKAAK